MNNIKTPFIITEDDPQNVARTLIQNGDKQKPFYIFDMDEAYRRIQHLRRILPRVKLFYATRTNDTLMILRLAQSQNLDFDCASPEEIYKLRKKLTVSPSNMIYTTPIKTSAHINYAKETGITYSVFDCSFGLKKVNQIWPDARLLLQIKVDNVTCIEDLKYGCDYDNEAIGLLEEAAALGSKVVGIKFHGDGSPDSYVKGLKCAKALFDHEQRAGRQMNIVDIGGELTSEKTDGIDKISILIKTLLEDLFPDSNTQIFADASKYICVSAFTLYCNIGDVRRVKIEDRIVNMIYMTDGVYGSLRYCNKSVRVTKFQAKESNEPYESEEIILWGPSGDALDHVMVDSKVCLPKCTFEDWLVFSHNGANSLSFATKFSSIDKALMQPVISFTLWNKLKFSEGFVRRDEDVNYNNYSLLTKTTLVHINNNSHRNIPKLCT